MATRGKRLVITESELAVPGGAATLDETGKISKNQLPDNIAVLDKDGKLVEGQLPDNVLTLDENGKMKGSQLPDYSVARIEGLKEALERLADKATQERIKQDTADIMETGYTILAELRGQRPRRYGYRVKIAEPDPSGRVEYLFDAVGMTPARMDYDRQEFDYGDWKDIWFVRDNYACMVKNSGEEDYRLDPNNYGLKEQDGAASDAGSMEYPGNAMSAIPLCWVSRYQEGGYQYVIFCEQKYDESYHAYAHTKADGTIAKVAYHACFEGSVKAGETAANGTLRSIAGDNVYPESLSAAEQERNMAKKNGANWEIRTWALQSLIADMCTLISKTFNSQEAFGQGNTTGYVNDPARHYGMVNCGALKDKGQFYGRSDTTHAVKVFHIENFWGNRWDRVAGLVLDNGTCKAKMTPEGGGYNLTGSGYAAVGPTIRDTAAASGNGWQKDTLQTEFGRLPVMPLKGSDATYETDSCWYTREGVRVAVVGGACENGSRCGARCLYVNNAASVVFWGIGASLSLIGPS